MVIHQGDIFWVAAAEPQGLGSGIPHPHVVVQEDDVHCSGIHTVVVCALTTNRKRVSQPGNVLLEAGEANLPRQSIVEVSKLLTVDKAHLGEFIGSLSQPRIDQILAGIQFVQRLMKPGETDGG
jgi:mRNA interferase MazF